MDICKLGDIAKFTTGKLNSNAAQDNGRYPFFTCAPEALKIDEYAFDTEAIILAGNNAEGNFHIQYFKGKFNAYQRTYVIESLDENKVDTKYLYYALKTCLLHFKQISQGSATKFLTAKILNSFELPIPEIKKQKKIAEVLGNLDKKIKINTAINKNLEQQIEAILLKTIDNADTQPVRLGDYLYIKGRIGWKGLKKSEYLPVSDYRIINGESLTLSGIDWNKAGYISAERYEESPEIMLNIGDILLSKDGTIGKIGYVDKLETRASVASGIFVIRNTRQTEISTQFIYYLLKSRLFKAFIASRTEGSVIPHLYQKDFMEFEFPLPSPDDMRIFDNTTAAMFSMVFSNLSENERLIHLRDSLLPKLISGEIDVSTLNI